MESGMEEAADRAATAPLMRTARRLIMVKPPILNVGNEHVAFRYRLKILFSFFIIAFSNRRRT
jgi:hypothetical protein